MHRKDREEVSRETRRCVGIGSESDNYRNASLVTRGVRRALSAFLHIHKSELRTCSAYVHRRVMYRAIKDIYILKVKIIVIWKLEIQINLEKLNRLTIGK